MIMVNWGSISDAMTEVFHTGIFWLLIVVIFIDFITGTAHSIINKDLSSSTGIYGLIKHSIVIMLVVATAVSGILVDVDVIGYVFTSFYVFEYIVSILENLDKLGIKFPEQVTRVLRQWQDKNNSKWGE